MTSFTQSNRALALTTPLGPDALLLEKLEGAEAISELFRFRLHLLAPAAIDFRKVLNQWATVRITLTNGSSRFIHGFISRLSQGGQVPGSSNQAPLIRYSAELVPNLWRLGKRVRSRIFQNQSVPDILKAVLGGDWQLDCTFRLSGHYEPRNYCVQYAESDLAFVSRLMEEEGIAYYFVHEADDKHEHDKHTLVLTDNPGGFAPLPNVESIAYQARRDGVREAYVWEWEKTQEVTAGTHALSDYHFEIPANRLTAQAAVAETLDVGKVQHSLHFSHRVADKETLEVFDFPAGYAHRFDEIDAGGKPRGREIEKLHDDKQRVARLRAEEAAAWSLGCEGAGSCAAFLPGHQFQLTRHFDAEDRYLLTRVEHEASVEGTYTSGDRDAEPVYTNRFRALPAALPFRPRRVTSKPRVDGLQTATVTGPKDRAVFVDPHGRVKVKFHWDRDHANDAGSSCWVRVSQPWAGPGYGAFFWPRIGHEVVIGFEHGDPDRPLITGSVYNAENLPPVHPADQAYMAGIKTASLGADPHSRFNAMLFDDRPNQEVVHLHSETSAVITAEAGQVQRSSAPSFQVNGRLVLMPATSSGSGGGSEVGSGSGGGFDLETYKVLAGPMVPAVEKLIGNWKEHGFVAGAAAMGQSLLDSASNTLASLYGNNSKTTFTIGGETKGYYFGNRKTHITCGADLKYIVDPISLFFGFMGGKQASAAAGSAAKKMYTAFCALTDPIGLVAPPIGGGVDLICAPNTKQTYFGPKVDINRCEKYELHAPNFTDVQVTSPKEALAFCALQALTFGRLVLDTAAAVYYHGAGSEGKNVFLNIANGGAMDRLHGFLALFEKVLAIVAAGKKKTEENRRLADLARSEMTLSTPSPVAAIPAAIPRQAAESRLDMIDHLLKKTRVDLHNAQVALAGYRDTFGSAGGGNIMRAGDWNVAAGNISLTTGDMRPIVGPPAASTLRLEATGPNNGVVDINATGNVIIHGGTRSTFNVSDAGLSLTCLNTSAAPLPTAGRVHVSDTAVSLAAGSNTFIRVADKVIQLKAGEFSLTINGTDAPLPDASHPGITLKVNGQVIMLKTDRLALVSTMMRVGSDDFRLIVDRGRVATNDWDVEPR